MTSRQLSKEGPHCNETQKFTVPGFIVDSKEDHPESFTCCKRRLKLALLK
jgi:hypothetical protein